MKKKLALALSALVCALCCAFGLAACNNGDKPGQDSKDLSKYLGTDAELTAMTPTDSKYFKFTLLDTPAGEPSAYEISVNSDIPASEIEKITDWVIPSSYNDIRVKQIAKDGFKNAFGEKNAYDGTYTNVYIQPGVERICEGGLYDWSVYILQLPSTLKVIEQDAVTCNVFKAGSGLQVIKSGNSINFKGYSYGTEENKYADYPVCFPDSLEYCDLTFSTALDKGSGNTKDKSGVYYCGNPNNPYLIAHHYEKVAGETPKLNKDCKMITPRVFKDYSLDVLDLTEAANLTQIGDEAFKSAKIVQLHMPDSVKYIGEEAFSGCSSLAGTVTLPGSVKQISTDAFAGCTGVQGTEYGRCLYLGTTENPYYYLLRAIRYGEDAGLNPDTETNGYDINEDTKIIAQEAFKSAYITWDSTLSSDPGLDMDELVESALSLVVPDGIVAIGKEAFYNDEHILRGVSFPGNWATLHDNAEKKGEAVPLSYYAGKNFSEEDGLTDGKGVATIIIREGYENVGSGAFADLGTLNALILPQSLVSVGYEPLANTTVYSLTIPKSGYGLAQNVKHLTVVGSGEDVLYQSSFRYSKIESVTLKGIRQISGYAFDYANKLKTVTMSADVKSINSSAFENCYNLTDIYFDGTTTQWESVYKDKSWDTGTGNYIVHCSNGDIAKS